MTTIEDIFSAVSKVTDIPIVEMKKKSRVRNLVFARQIAFYIANKRYRYGTVILGEYVNQDHTSVTHATSVIRKWSESDMYDVNNIISKCLDILPENETGMAEIEILQRRYDELFSAYIKVKKQLKNATTSPISA